MLFIFFLVAYVQAQTFGTDNCCKSSQCTNYQPPASVYCVGATGSGCSQIVLNALGIDITPVPFVDYKNGSVSMFTSVGSIMHDACCKQYPHGMMCNQYNFNYFDTLKVSSVNHCACMGAWRKAVLNVLSKNGWMETYSTSVPSDRTVVRTMRKAMLPVSLLEYDTVRSSYGLSELKATSVRCAPKGTHLDCSKNDNNCKVGIGKFSKTYANGVVAGDSDFCCSKLFSSTHVTVVGERWGVCK